MTVVAVVSVFTSTATTGGAASSLNLPSRGALARPDANVLLAAAMIPHATDHPPCSMTAPAEAAELSVIAPTMMNARLSEVISVEFECVPQRYQEEDRTDDPPVELLHPAATPFALVERLFQRREPFVGRRVGGRLRRGKSCRSS